MRAVRETTPTRTVDFAVIGAGIAGLSAALAAPPHCRVGVFAKRPLGSAASGWAQGGIAAALHEEDSAIAHQQDTISAGAGLCRAEAVEKIVSEAPAAIEWLIAQGVPFNTQGNGLALAQEGGHSRRRIAHVDDRSGQAVLEVLIAQVRQRENIILYDCHIAVDLAIDGGRCSGFYALDQHSGQVEAITASAVLLACGGAGRVYLYSSTPDDATGDGIGMAYRAGCTISNMEFMQFHPTCLYHPQPPTLLISEAVRGEGARLINHKGERFAIASHPQGELAPRDVVARAIDTEMKKTGADCVYLDCSDKPEAFWQQRFPTIVAECAKRGVHLPQNAVPVVPAMHYCCGGVETDIDGQTTLPGLYAAGETANTGLHGANRLASNSLLECVVMGRAVAHALELVPPAAAVPAWDEQRISPAKEAVMVTHNWDELRRIMWNYVGIVRSDERLQRARLRVQQIHMEVEEFYRLHRVNRDFLELRNLVQCAELIIEGALARRESRGLHYNIDCPEQSIPADTRFSREDFAERHRARNSHCPFSGRMVVAGATTIYRGEVVGFCNPHCRDDFAAASAQNFAGASVIMQTAKEKLDAALTTK